MDVYVLLTVQGHFRVVGYSLDLYVLLTAQGHFRTGVLVKKAGEQYMAANNYSQAILDLRYVRGTTEPVDSTLQINPFAAPAGKLSWLNSAHTHTHTHTRARTHARTHAHTRTHARTHARMRVHIHTHTHK